MAATIAHEINNPIETATNILYLLARNSSLDDAAREWVKTADEELRRVGQITRTTLGFYRERDTAVVPVNLAELLDSILSLYHRRVQSVGVSVDKEFQTTATIPGISGELRQVFTNLVANAIDALSTAGTRLIVHLRESVNWRDSSRRGVRVTIADDGPGMSTDTLPNLFQPFYTTKGKQGTGLGLWVSRGIVASHGGSIRVKSNNGPHHGTCFTVFLPSDRPIVATHWFSS
jgi:two-component system CheB/CheR fusion protein